MSSSSVKKRPVSVSILAVVAMQLPFVHSVLSLNETNAYLHHICLNGEGTFKSGSPYENEIKQLIDLMSTFIKDNGFLQSVSGYGPDDINVKFQCRGDILISKCRSCLATAFSGDAESFNKKTRDFLYNLMLKADKPKGGSYASGEMRLGTKNLYAMVQCALDIFECKDCLQWSINELFKCCHSKQGARFLGTSCSMRYEL